MGGKETSWGKGGAGGVPRRFTLGTHWYKESPRNLENPYHSHPRRVRGVGSLTGDRALPQWRTCLQRGKGRGQGLPSVGEPRDLGASAPTSCSPPRNPPPRSPTSPGERASSRAPLSAPGRVPAPASAAPPPHRVY